MSFTIGRIQQVSARLRLLPLILVWLVVPISYAQDSAADYLGDSSAVISATETTVQPSLQPRIIGGTPVLGYPVDYPWMAALVRGYREDIFDGLFCGGTLVAPRWVMTAAHCVHNNLGQLVVDIDVVLGTNSLAAAPYTYERISIEQAIPHPAFTLQTLDYDIALLRLERSSSLPVIAYLADSLHEPVPETLLTAIGWGSVDPVSINLPAQLQEVELPLVSLETCRSALPGLIITDNMLCAGWSEGGRDTCVGDSGGPLFHGTSTAGYQLVGITSFGSSFGCAQPDSYGVYTRVSRMTEWVNSVLADYPDAVDPSGWVDFRGQVRLEDGTPVCALVLINGEHEFTCNGGNYHLRSPLANGDATVFAFADGFTPYKIHLTPLTRNMTWDVIMTPANSAQEVPAVTLNSVAMLEDGAYAELQGLVTNSWSVPLSALVLANGEAVFTYPETGHFVLTAPIDANGVITLFAFVDGHSPYKMSFQPAVW